MGLWSSEKKLMRKETSKYLKETTKEQNKNAFNICVCTKMMYHFLCG